MSKYPSFVQEGDNSIKENMKLIDVVSVGLEKYVDVERNGRLWASQTAMCARQGALEATYVGSNKETSAKQFYCEIGNIIESLIIEGLENDGRLLFDQYQVPDVGLNLGGYVDAIAIQGGLIRSVEIKSCGALPASPREDQKAQAMIYSALTGLPATIIYFSRSVADWNGKLKTKQFDFVFDADELNPYLLNAVYARMCIDEGILPEMPGHFTNQSQCHFCNYKGLCWDDRRELSHLEDVGFTKLHEDILLRKAPRKANAVMDAVNERRNGVLKHLSINGTDIAKGLLRDTDWSQYY
jgi:hypothetical protein